MKKIKLTLFFALIANLTLLLSLKANSSPNLFTITISTVDHYIPGTSMDVNFVLDYRTVDFDYGDYISLTFPEGITPNGSPTNPFSVANEGQGPEFLNAVSGQEISWGSNNNDQWGGIEIGVHSFIVNVTIDPGLSGDQFINVLVSGSEYGTSQADISTTCQIREFPDGPDLSVIARDLEYTNFPLSQSNLNIIGDIKNTGLELSNATDVLVTCNLASYAENFAVSLPLPFGGSQTFSLPSITPFTEGVHEIVFNTTTLDDPYQSNNTDTISIGVDSVYAHDDGGIAYTFGHQSVEYGLGSVFDIFNPDELSAVQFYLGRTATAGVKYSLSVNSIIINGSVPTLGDAVWESDTLTVENTTPGSWATVNILNGVMLDEGKYILIIHERSSGSIELGFDGNPNGDLYRSYPGGADFFEDEAFGYPMLRLVFGVVDIQTNVSETVKESELSIYPNPTTGIVHIENAEDDNLAVYDIHGVKIIELSNSSKNKTIDISKYAPGSYLLQVDSKTEVINLIEE